MSNGQIIVTGGSRGIGAAIVRELADRGYAVTSLSRSGDVVAGVGMACDVTNHEAVSVAVAAVAARGPIVGLVNSAGAHSAAPSATLPIAEFESVMRLNATSVLSVTQAVYPHLVAAGSSLIVNIGSFFDKLGVAENLAYCASKAVIGAFTRCLAVEWAAAGIRVVNVAPGYIKTDLNAEFLDRQNVRSWLARRVPMKRAGEPAEVARIVAALFSENVGFLTGETIYLDGGQGMNH
ncbi:MAG TPA: SDR family oxidoreductase [Steroidobacter sp.]